MAIRTIKMFQPPLPREHGAWAMFAVPLLIGVGVAGKFNGAVLLFALVAFGFFLLRYPLMLAIKSRAPQARAEALRWSALYGSMTLSGGVALLALSQQGLLIPIGFLGLVSLGIYLALAARRAEMSLLGEWSGIAGLALSAPGVYLLATQTLQVIALELYALNLLYFGGTVFYIKFKVREQPRAVSPTAGLAARLWAGRTTIAYHTAVLIAIAILAIGGWLPAIILIAFALPFCKALNGVLTRPARLNIPRLGWMEVAVTSVFTLVVLVAYNR